MTVKKADALRGQVVGAWTIPDTSHTATPYGPRTTATAPLLPNGSLTRTIAGITAPPCFSKQAFGSVPPASNSQALGHHHTNLFVKLLLHIFRPHVKVLIAANHALLGSPQCGLVATAIGRLSTSPEFHATVNALTDRKSVV